MNSLLPYLPQVAAILLAASRMIPRLESLWGWLPAKFRWLPPVLVVALPQIADALGVVESPLDLAEAVALAVALLVPGARSSTHAKLAKGVSVLALFLLPVLTACSPASTPEARGATAAQVTRLAYSAAAVTLSELTELHLEAQRAVTTPDQAAVLAPTLREGLKALEAARSALETARPYLEPGKDEAEARRFLRDALGQIDVLLPLLKAVGVQLPDEVVESLGYLRGFLGGAQ
jgi:hypothetical protein